MRSLLEKQAKELAAQSYQTVIVSDETTDNEPIFVAYNPELRGCMAQGETVAEAVEELAEARLEYILSLLEDGLPIPPPQNTCTGTTSGGAPTTAIYTYTGSPSLL